MSKTFVFVGLFLTLFTNARALETDNFLTWGVHLEDSSEDVNRYINSKVERVLEKINKKSKKLDCEEVRYKIIKSFRGFITHPMEHWLESNLGPLKVFPDEDEFTDREYFMMSIYGTERFDVSKYFSISRTVNTNGIYHGTDKFSHWMSTGARYYRVYLRALKKGKSEEDAFKKAIDYGIFLDRYVLGGISSGVFSYGDLEANFQGLLFNKNFCRLESSENYLKKTNNEWSLQRKIDVKDYVNPNWDETFNPSLFSRLKWEKVKTNFKRENCVKIRERVFQDRFDYYSRILIPSFSFKYIEELKLAKRKLPPNQSRKYTNICE